MKLFILFFFTITQIFLFGEEEKIKDPLVNYDVCSPIAIQPNSPLAALQSKILGNLDMELAILLKGDASFEAIILWKELDSFRCDFRVIYYKDVYSDKGLDKDLISACEVDIKSEPIDQGMVAILKSVLKNQIKNARYEVAPGFKWSNYLDGSVYNVYVKGGENDIFPLYAATFFNPKIQGSYSCASIALALKIFAVNENKDFRTVPITQLTNYLIEVREGRVPTVDPTVQESIPDPEFELPR